LHESARWQEWASFALGLWLAISPWVCGYAEGQPAATGNAAFMGIAVALLSHFEASLDTHSADWLNLGAGMWLVVAPFALGFSSNPVPAVNCVAVGTALALLAASALSLDKELEKWWHKRFLED